MMREDRKRAEQRQKKIARRKREVRRMKRKLYKAGILAAAGIIVLAVILMLCGSGNAKKSAKKTSSAKTKTETSEKTETKTPEEIEAEKVQEVLDSDQYKDQLGELYKKNPETKEIILNREKYSDDLLTWLFDHQEALQWVIDYPEQSARSEEELSAQGLQAVDLKDYRIRTIFRYISSGAKYGDMHLMVPRISEWVDADRPAFPWWRQDLQAILHLHRSMWQI